MDYLKFRLDIYDKSIKKFLEKNKKIEEFLSKKFVKRYFGMTHEEMFQKGWINETWSAHLDSKVDIAVIPINVDNLKKDQVEFKWIKEDLMATIDRINSLEICQGDEIFVVGFPMGITGEEKNYTILRSGIIARLDDEIINQTKSFLIDSFVFPGNSGSPVILKPSIVSIEGTNPVNTAYLIGVVSSYIPYEEVAYSLQTDPPKERITFTENSGLASVVPLDYIREIVSTLLSKKPEEENKEKLAVEDKENEETSPPQEET